MKIERWPSSGIGRSRTVAYGKFVWTVANASDAAADFDDQVLQTLGMLQKYLIEAGSDKTRILSVQVMLTDIAKREAFDKHWQEWIGADPQCWPQRTCFQAGLAPGLEIELAVVAASSTRKSPSEGFPL